MIHRWFLVFVCVLSVGRLWAQSNEVLTASGEMMDASGTLLTTSLQLSGEVALTVGEPLADIVVAIARGSGMILKDVAVMSAEITTGGLKLATRPLAFSNEVLTHSQVEELRHQVVEKVCLMTAGDAMKLLKAVKGGPKAISPEISALLKDLDFNPQSLAGSVLINEGLERFAGGGDQPVFAIKTKNAMLLVYLEDLERGLVVGEVPTTVSPGKHDFWDLASPRSAGGQ